MNAIELGFDIFTGSYPYILTQKGHACLFDYYMNSENDGNINDDNDKNVDDSHNDGPVKKKRKYSFTSNKETFLDLNDKKYIFNINIV